MLDKYCVVTKKGYSVSDIEKELVSDGGSPTIPERQVEITEQHSLSTRTTEFSLTEQEAENLKNDSRILSVDLVNDPNIKIQPCLIQEGNFDRTATAERNWGLKRHSTRDKTLYDSFGQLDQADQHYKYNNAGEGVDILILDSGVQADHPDFIGDDGNTRVQKIDWIPFIEGAGYEITDNIRESFAIDNYYIETGWINTGSHGTECASIAAGNLYGWAKKAHIYSCKFVLDDRIWANVIKYWHQNKKTNRPTIVSISKGVTKYGYNMSEITGGSFADAETERTTWERGSLTNAQIANTYKIRNSRTAGIDFSNPMTTHQSSYSVVFEELADAGVHIVIAAGNTGDRSVRLDSPEFDNTVTYDDSGTSRTTSYNDPSSYYSDDKTILVSALERVTEEGTGDERLENLPRWTTRGSAISLAAAGDDCMAASSSDSNYNQATTPYPNDSNYFIRRFGGTSCACPQVAGVLALYLSEQPTLSPVLAKKLLEDKASTGAIYDPQVDFNADHALVDTPNKILYSRNNSDIGFTLNNVSTTNINLGQKYKFKTFFRRDANIFVNYIGINALNTDGNDGEFYNNNFSAIYPNTKIVSMFAYNTGLDAETDLLRYEIILKFDGASVYNGGWNTMEIADKQVNLYVKLKRKDADFDPIKQEFTWIHYDNNSILQMKTEMQNKIGFW